MGFTILSWNVESFDGDSGQLAEVVQHIKQDQPEIFGLFEIENINIIDLLDNHFQDYNFHLTEGAQNKEILVAIKKNRFTNTVFTQKREFKVFNPFLRPGAFITLKDDGKLYNILFLHTDSGTEAPDFGNRQEMFEKIWKLKKALDKKTSNPNARLIVLGDVNTMGLSFPTRRKSDLRVSSKEEIEILDKVARKSNMKLLQKDEDLTFNNLRLTSDLDHVVASQNLVLKDFATDAQNPIHVMVRGWNQLSGNDRENFIENVSDHSSLTIHVVS
ncbi:MAG: endonuclease/exonuclease/phosphatase family protein [Bacteroidota bacterium]